MAENYIYAVARISSRELSLLNESVMGGFRDVRRGDAPERAEKNLGSDP